MYIDRTKAFFGVVAIAVVLNLLIGVVLLDLGEGGTDTALRAGQQGTDEQAPTEGSDSGGEFSGQVDGVDLATDTEGSADGTVGTDGASDGSGAATSGGDGSGAAASGGNGDASGRKSNRDDSRLLGGISIAPDLERQGVTAGEIKVGGITTTSGALAYSNVVETVKAYFAMTNDRGGVHGRRLTYVSYDDGLDPARGMEAAKRLVEKDRVFALLGNFAIATTPQLVSSGFLEAYDVPLFGNHGVEEETFQTPWAWPVGTAAYRSGYTQAQWLITDQKLPKICAIYLDVKPARWSLAGLTDGAKKFGSPLVQTVPVSLAEPDYTPALLNCRNSGAQVVVGITDAGGGIRLVQAHDRMGSDMLVVGTEDYGGDAISSQAGDAAEGLIAVDVWEYHTGSPGAEEYLGAMRRYSPNTKITGLSTTAWVAAKLFVHCLNELGEDPTRSGIIACYNGTTEWDSSLGPKISYSPDNHDGNRGPYFVQLENSDKGLTWKPISPRIYADIPSYRRAD